MKTLRMILPTGLALCAAAAAADWPMWGGTPDRNMVGKAAELPVDVSTGEMDPDTEQVDLSGANNIRWVAKLGSQTYGNTVVGSGKVLVGTNNEAPRDPKQKGDRGVLMCFDEKSGEFQWQLIVPKLGAGKVSDWELVGLCSSPAVEGERAWLVTNRGELVCLDLNGMADGNAGPFKDEAKFMSADPAAAAVEIGKQHADIIWIFDMRKELGIFPHNVSSCSPLVVGDIVYTATSNGVDWSHTNIPAPLAPSLVALDKNTGKLVGEEISGVSDRVLHASWSSPAYGEMGGHKTVVWGGGDGFAYGFEPKPVMDEDEGFPILKELWRHDCNPPRYRKNEEGESIKYATFKGPSEVIGTTVVDDNRTYVVIGQDPEHGDGVGMLSCLEGQPGGAGVKVLWTFSDIGRSISTPSVADGLVFVAEYDGDLHCLDAATGKEYWKYETLSRVWASTLVADGKVFLPTEDSEVHILEAGKEMKVLGTIEFGGPIYSSPVVANDVLYIGTMTHLYAIGSK